MKRRWRLPQGLPWSVSSGARMYSGPIYTAPLPSRPGSSEETAAQRLDGRRQRAARARRRVGCLGKWKTGGGRRFRVARSERVRRYRRSKTTEIQRAQRGKLKRRPRAFRLYDPRCSLCLSGSCRRRVQDTLSANAGEGTGAGNGQIAGAAASRSSAVAGGGQISTGGANVGAGGLRKFAFRRRRGEKLGRFAKKLVRFGKTLVQIGGKLGRFAESFRCFG